jgi:hypothetical protein
MSSLDEYNDSTNSGMYEYCGACPLNDIGHKMQYSNSFIFWWVAVEPTLGGGVFYAENIFRLWE